MMDGLDHNKTKHKSSFKTDKHVHFGNKTMGNAAQNLFDINPYDG